MCEETLVPVNLLKYKLPYQVVLDSEELKKNTKFLTMPVNPNQGFPVCPNIPGLTNINVGPQDFGLTKSDMSNILNSILPPKEWTEDDEIWRQEILNTPATRIDVISLEQNLNMALKQRQARNKGICPIRRELYSQIFDELIRHVTINNAERGLLLMRIRDEIRMNLSAHEKLFEIGFAYGTRKANVVQDGYEETEQKLKELMDDKEYLETQLQEHYIQLEQIERKHSETRVVDEKRTADEIQFLKRANQQLRAQLEGIQGIKKT